MTIQQFKSQAIKTLSETSPSAPLDVSVMLEFCLKQNKTWILMNNTAKLTEEQLDWLNQGIEKRRQGLPVAYITGHKEFYGYDFFVSPAVLIPKPDTEILIEKALDEIIAKMDARPNIVLSICDMCTGSGCIGISVLRQLIDEYHIPAGKLPKFTFVDISSDALEMARKNAVKLLGQEEKDEHRFIQSNLFEDVPYTFDIILTNPPYIPASMVDELLKDGRSEPRLALDGDVGEYGQSTATNDGLDLIRRLIPQAYERLIHNGVLLMETGEYNAEQTKTLFQEQGFRCTKIIPDLEGQNRDVYGIK